MSILQWSFYTSFLYYFFIIPLCLFFFFVLLATSFIDKTAKLEGKFTMVNLLVTNCKLTPLRPISLSSLVKIDLFDQYNFRGQHMPKILHQRRNNRSEILGQLYLIPLLCSCQFHVHWLQSTFNFIVKFVKIRLIKFLGSLNVVTISYSTISLLGLLKPK